MTNGPVLIDLETKPTHNVSEAPPVPDLPYTLPKGQAMQVAAQLASRRPSRLARWFWSLLGLIIGTIVSVAAWDFVNDMIARSPTLGWLATALVAAFVLVALGLVVRELAGFARLRKVDAIRSGADAALSSKDVKKAQGVLDQLNRL